MKNVVEKRPLVMSMLRLYDYGVTVKAHSGVLDTMERLIEKNAGTYDPSNQTVEWQEDNVRYEESLMGERNMFVYVMHTLRTEPGWVDVEVLDSKQDQYDKALDLIIVGRTDQPETEQCKTGHLGKSGDLYVHKDWLKGSPTNVVAVCTEHGVIYGGPLDVWNQVYKEGASAISGEAKWMYVSYFKECGGWVVDIHEDVKKLISIEETSE